MSKNVLAILEQREGTIKKSSFEVLSFVETFSAGNGFTSHAIVIGFDIVNIEEIKKFFSGSIITIKHEKLHNYSSSAYVDLLSDFIKANSIDLIFLSNTVFGRDIAPRIAIRTDAGLAMDCVEISNLDGEFIATRPVYAGKSLEEVKVIPERKIFTLRQNVFKKEELSNFSAKEIKFLEPQDLVLRTKAKEIRKTSGKLDVAEADIIVSGGRGMKGPEHFHLIEELADVLGAAVGASRAVVDAGWRPHNEQVGQTGKTVSPSLYIACGISGAIQHLAGMSSSKYIVAVNKDKDAPIFSVANYGITGDVFEIIPALVEELKKA
jgi:electron transfer flavoprotein alpha subunit